ncbi:MAG: hypothetical protein ACK5QQ_15460 [Cyanobacteriota bacterium]
MRELNQDRETEAAVIGALGVHGPHLGGCWIRSRLTDRLRAVTTFASWE